LPGLAEVSDRALLPHLHEKCTHSLATVEHGHVGVAGAERRSLIRLLPGGIDGRGCSRSVFQARGEAFRRSRCSSAFPPILSSTTLPLPGKPDTPGVDPAIDPYGSQAVLSDGGAHYNLGLETIAKRFTLLVSDAAKRSLPGRILTACSPNS
jgi:hypothetical protein